MLSCRTPSASTEADGHEAEGRHGDMQGVVLPDGVAFDRMLHKIQAGCGREALCDRWIQLDDGLGVLTVHLHQAQHQAVCRPRPA